MEYKILSANASTFWGDDITKASEDLTSQVQLAIRDGWVPAGGVSVGHARGKPVSFLFQAMIRHDKLST